MGTCLSFSLYYLVYVVPLKNVLVMEYLCKCTIIAKLVNLYLSKHHGDLEFNCANGYANGQNVILCFVNQGSTLDSRDHDELLPEGGALGADTCTYLRFFELQVNFFFF